ncbi:hypothetical protein ACS0TY_023268 [Phlomoides rotata]
MPHEFFHSFDEVFRLRFSFIDSCSETWIAVLQDIAFKCETKVVFKQTIVSSTELQFVVEVLFVGERIGEGGTTSGC